MLRPLVHRVVVSDPKHNAWIGRDPKKNDQADAYKLAELLRLGHVREVYYATDADRAVFKQVVQHYDAVTHEQVRLKHKIKARFRSQGVIPRGDEVFDPQGREAYIARVAASAIREVLRQQYELLDQALNAQRKARRLIKQLGLGYPEVARFLTVPGVGIVIACRFSAYVQTPHRFSNRRKLWRYCRLGIVDRSSDGKPLGRRKLDWSGIGSLKAATRTAFMAAMRRKDDNGLKRFYRDSLRRTENPTHARLNTQRKIVSILFALWKGGMNYQDERA